MHPLMALPEAAFVGRCPHCRSQAIVVMRTVQQPPFPLCLRDRQQRRKRRYQAREYHCRTCLSRFQVVERNEVTHMPERGRTLLTWRRQELLRHIQTYTAEHGCGPTIRELCALSGFRSTSGVKYHLDRLREQRRIDWTDGKARTLHLTPRERKRGG